jgi:uncharacterized phiE125 gp8 family phage protein
MKNLQIRTVTDLATEPVTLAEAKAWCKVTGTEDEDILTMLITSCRQALEEYTASSFAEKTIHATWIKPPEDMEFELPYGPHISVDKVYRIDAEGTETELTVNTDYWVYGDQDFVLKINKYWSTKGTYASNSYRVEYTAGYGDDNTETLPTKLKECILKEIVTQYDLRENIGISGSTELTNNSRREAGPYRRKVWF